MPEHHLTTEQKLLMHFHFIWLATSLYHTGQISCAEVLSLVVMMWRLKVRSADDRHKAAKSVLSDSGALIMTIMTILGVSENRGP